MTPSEPQPGDFGPRMARRVAARTGVRRHTGGARSIGVVSRSAVGFGQAIGRSRQTRPSVTADSLTSLRLRPPDGWWHTLGGAADTAEPVAAARTWTDDLVPPTRHTRRPAAAPAAPVRSAVVPAPVSAPAVASAAAPEANQPPTTGLGRLDALRNMLAAGVAPDGSSISPDVLQQQRPDDDVPAERLAPQRPAPRTPALDETPRPDAPAATPGSRHSLTEAGPATGPGALARRSQPEPVAPGTTAHRSPDPATPAASAADTEPSTSAGPRFGRTWADRRSAPNDRGGASYVPTRAPARSTSAGPGRGDGRPAVSPGRVPGGSASVSPAGSPDQPAHAPRPRRGVAGAPGSPDEPSAGSSSALGATARPNAAGQGTAPADALIARTRAVDAASTPDPAELVTAGTVPSDRTTALAGTDDLRLHRLISTDPARQLATVARRTRPLAEVIAPTDEPAVRPSTTARRRAEHRPRAVPGLPGSGTDQPVRRVTLPRVMSHVHRPAVTGRAAAAPQMLRAELDAELRPAAEDATRIVPAERTASGWDDMAGRAARRGAVTPSQTPIDATDAGTTPRPGVDGSGPQPRSEPASVRRAATIATSADVADVLRQVQPPTGSDARRAMADVVVPEQDRRVQPARPADVADGAPRVQPPTGSDARRASPDMRHAATDMREAATDRVAPDQTRSAQPARPADTRHQVRPPAGTDARAALDVIAPGPARPAQPAGPPDIADSRHQVQPPPGADARRAALDAIAPERARPARPAGPAPAERNTTGDAARGSVDARRADVDVIVPERARPAQPADLTDVLRRVQPPAGADARRATSDPAPPERARHSEPAVAEQGIARHIQSPGLADVGRATDAPVRDVRPTQPVTHDDHRRPIQPAAVAAARVAPAERASVRPPAASAPAAAAPAPSRDASASVLRRALAPAADDVTGRAAGRVRSDTGAALAERFMTELSQAVRARPTPLPTPFQPMAEQIAGRRNVLLSTDTASRRALRSVGKRAATVGDTIHVDATARQLVAPSARLTEVVAHELTHVAHHSPAPRFFDDIDESPEERRAESVARMIARSPLAPAASTLAAPHATASRDVIRRSPASSTSTAASSTAPGTIRADELAARITGASAPEVVHRQHTVAAPPRPATPPPPAPPAQVAPASPAPAAPAAPPPPAPEPSDTDSGQIRDRDEEFRDLLERHLDVILRRVEDHILIDIERRGGRAWRGF